MVNERIKSMKTTLERKGVPDAEVPNRIAETLERYLAGRSKG